MGSGKRDQRKWPVEMERRELAKLASVGEQLTVVGRGVVINIRVTKGVESLTTAELNRISPDW